MSPVQISEDQMVEYFTYLDNLQESRETNMFGSPAYLLNASFGIGRREAGVVFRCWSSTFDGQSSVEDRAKKALEGTL